MGAAGSKKFLDIEPDWAVYIAGEWRSPQTQELDALGGVYLYSMSGSRLHPLAWHVLTVHVPRQLLAACQGLSAPRFLLSRLDMT